MIGSAIAVHAYTQTWQSMGQLLLIHVSSCRVWWHTHTPTSVLPCLGAASCRVLLAGSLACIMA